MNKLIVALASLIAVTAVACAADPAPTEDDGSTNEVNVSVDTDSNIAPQATACWTQYMCSSTRQKSTYASCVATCPGFCGVYARCCQNGCRID